jgi:hypothetical protein
MSFKNYKLDWETARPRSPLKGLNCVYRVQIMDPKDPEVPLTYDRYGAPDTEGIAEIGFTTDALRRTNQFESTWYGNGTSTEALLGRYAYAKCNALRMMLGPIKNITKLLRFQYIEGAEEELPFMEGNAHRVYSEPHAEGPWLNSSIPGKKGIRDALSELGLFKNPTSPIEEALATPKSPETNMSCVYFVHQLMRDDISRFRPAPRIAGIDPDGIVLIGQSARYALRKSRWKQAILGRQHHTEAECYMYYYAVSPVMQQIVGPKENLATSYVFTAVRTRPDLRLLRERQALARYIALYGEPPLCNGQIPGKLLYLDK